MCPIKLRQELEKEKRKNGDVNMWASFMAHTCKYGMPWSRKINKPTKDKNK